MRSALFVTDRGGAQEHARCRLPAQALAHAGWRVAFTSGLIRPARRDPRIWHAELGSPAAVILRMVADPRVPQLIREAREAGQVFIADIDDLLWDIPEWSEVHSFAGRPEQIERLVEVMDACDLVTCSTPALAAAVAAHVSTPAMVVRNGIDVTAFRPHRADHRPLRLAYPGLLSFRRGDLATVAEPLRDVMHALNTGTSDPAVEIWHLGHRDDGPDIADVLGDIACPIVRRPWVNIRDLPRSYDQIDIAVSPLAPHPFNESRSAFTGLGLAAAGIPFLASPTGEYERLSTLGAGKIVTGDWRPALEGLIADAAFRRMAGTAGRQAVAVHHGLGAMAREWAGAIGAAATAKV